MVRLNLYRDCFGIDAPTEAVIDISSVSCGVSGLSYTLPLSPGTVTEPNPREVSPLCPSQLPFSTCNGGSYPGVEQNIYEAVVLLPAQCSDWVVNYTLCCRNDQITNLLTPGCYDLYVEALLNNTAGLCDNSPLFTSLPVPYVCAGQQFNYNHGAIDSDGDSLAFTIINPLDGPGINIPYTGSYSPTNPMTTTGAFAFDAITGQMTFTPSGTQVSVVAVLVQEYRNGVLIGSTMRDIQIVVITCSNNQPTIADGIQNVSGGNLQDSLTVEVCPGQLLSFDITAVDPDNNTLTLTSNVAQSIPGSSFTVSGSGDTLTGTFTWTPTPLDTGVNVFTVTITDGACPIVGAAVASFNVFVLNGTYAGPDLNYCPAGGALQLNALGGSSFSWTPADGLSSDTIRNPLASPSVTTSYIVTSDLSGLCKNKDTVTVFVVPDFVLTVSDDDTICRNSSTVLTASGSAQGAPYIFQWTPSSSLLNPATAAPTAYPDVTTTYHVSVTSSAGCNIRDSVTVVVSGTGPIVEISVDRNNVCPGDTVQLQGIIFPLDCGPTLSGCSAQNLPVIKPFADISPSTYFATPFEGNSEDAKFQALYIASDLLAAGITTGTITRIEFDIGSKASTGVFQNLTIKLGCTNATGLSASDGWLPVSTVVYGPAVYATTLGLNNFSLSTPYDWDGRSNLVLEICFNNPALASANGNDQLMSVATAYNATMRATNNNTDGCLLNPTFTYTQIPKTIFHICDPLTTNFTFSWTPVTGLDNPNIINPRAVVTGTQTYTLFVTNNNCDGSNFIMLNTDNSYAIQATPDTTICGAAAVQLNVNITGTPPASTLPCGTNGTTCQSTLVRQAGLASSSTGTGTPYEGFWEDGRVQYLYRASDLIAAGFTGSSTITALAFNVVTKGSTIPYSGYTIKMGCTTLSTLPSSTFVATGLTTVFGPVNYSTVLGWNTHTLASTYDWDGTANVIIEVCFNSAAYTDDDDVAYTATAGNTVLYRFTDGAIGCTLTGPSGTSNRPNLRFTFCSAPTGTTSVEWNPQGTLDNAFIENPIATVSVSTTYTVEYTFVNGCVRVDSAEINVVTFNASAGPDTSICRGESVQLSIVGGNIFNWESLPGLTCYTCANPIATPDSTTDYLVTITDASGSCVRRDTVSIVVFQSPRIQFSNDSIYCYITSLNLDAGAGFANYLWNTAAPTQSITVTSPGLYSVTVEDVNGCVQSDSISLQNNNPPTVNLGSDQIKCDGDSVKLHAGAGFAAYTWSDASSDSTITVYSTGNYSVTVADANNCPAFDTVLITFSTPNVNLGPDTSLCAGVSLLLVAGNSENNYLWSGGTTDTFFVANQPGMISVRATDGIGCIDRDTIAVNYFPANPVNIGADKTTCNNLNVNFNAGPGYADYDWSNGSATQSINVSIPNTYSVTVTDANSCTYTDSAVLTDVTPSVSIGNDTSVCQGQSVTFDAGAGFTTYQWSGGSVSQSIIVSATGVYAVTVTAGANCTATDNVRLVVHPLPQPDLGNADSVCPGHILFPGNNFDSYLWNDNSTDSIFIVNFSGNYSVTVTDDNGCMNSASLDLVVYALDLALNDIQFCDTGDSAILSAPAGMVSYQWSTGATSQSIVVKNSGTYSVTVVNSQGCVGSDDANVGYDSLGVDATANPVFVGVNGSTTLNANVINGFGAYAFNWLPAETLDDPTLQSPQASPTTNTTYTVVVADLESGCTATDTVNVIADSKFALPEAFTPNGEGPNENDRFEILGTGFIVVKEFRIYNRWGEIVSTDVTGWDGKYKGKDQPVGTYTYYAVVQLANGETKTQKGVFSLLR